ncbi:hypothetical protein PN498_16675 [Oscillatoria sp. CS-180]|uniref:hypothetical protein n=1 Tax=Oscillatoria sp. CS-180 TaxID=3021720 RepID=UPI00232EA886|nr:hypothetical protein [Oscillatoria sp. CS-180]MDB9527633.1 hypothetical protein [Oscillatoria sp. CS-180]
MSSPITVACGFLGGTILSTEGGYRVLQHPRPERVFDRIADARWFLAVSWCDHDATPTAILTHDGQLSFQNQAVLALGEDEFLPQEQRKPIFDMSLSLAAGDTALYTVQKSGGIQHQVRVLGLEIDPRYGRVAIVQAIAADFRPERSPF